MEGSGAITQVLRAGETARLTLDDLSLSPSRFSRNGKPVVLINGWTIGLLQEKPGTPNIMHMRGFVGEGGLTMNYGIVQMADSSTAAQTALDHCLAMYPGNRPDAGPDVPAPADDPVRYRRVDGDPEGLTDDPFTYEWRGSNPDMLYRWSSKYLRVVEADFLDLTYEYLPHAFVMNETGPFGYPFMSQFCIVTGTYEGRPVKHFGVFDRLYFGAVSPDAASDDVFRIALYFGGVRTDGRREWGLITLDSDQRGIAYYCRDGETPIVATDVTVEAEWTPLPYVDDGTMVNAGRTLFRFADKTICYDAQWGSKGQNYQLLNWRGFSASGGTWQEESAPAEYEIAFAYCENHNALQDHLAKAGFTV